MPTPQWPEIYREISDIESDFNSDGGRFAYAAGLRHVLTVELNLPPRRSADSLAALSSGVDCLGLALLQEGTLTANTKAGAITLEAGDVRLVDLSQARDWRAARDAPLSETTLYFARQRFAHVLVRADVSGWVSRAGSVTATMLGGMLETLQPLPQRMSGAELDLYGDALISVASTLVSTSLTDRMIHDRRTTPMLTRIRAFIDQHLGSDALTPDLIAGQFGMSRPVLYRHFEPLGGVTTYIRRQRMARALSALSGGRASDQQIATLAGRLGYASAAAFTRAFRETYGITPRQVGKVSASGHNSGTMKSLLAPLCASGKLLLTEE